MPLPIDPTIAATGAEWQIQPVAPGATEQPGAAGEESFGSMLAGQIEALAGTQTEGAKAARDLATGTAEDPASVMLAVERARLSMETAVRIRDRSVEAFQELFRTQV